MSDMLPASPSPGAQSSQPTGQPPIARLIIAAQGDLLLVAERLDLHQDRSPAYRRSAVLDLLLDQPDTSFQSFKTLLVVQLLQLTMATQEFITGKLNSDDMTSFEAIKVFEVAQKALSDLLAPAAPNTNTNTNNNQFNFIGSEALNRLQSKLNVYEAET